MRKAAVLMLAVAALGGCGEGAKQAEPANRQQPAARGTGPAAAQGLAGATPMAERVAVLGFLNKRNGIARDLILRPGQSIKIKDVVVHLRACETTPPWEFDKLTGAFVQLDVQQPGGGWRRAFSGWLYKESPSLNVVEHPVYDVWPKSCVMSFPEAAVQGPAPEDDSNPSSESQSGGGAPSRARAAPSNAT